MAHSTTPVLSVVVPVYNEQASLESLQQQLHEVLGSIGDSYEIIYVDDGSTDGSAELVQQWHHTDERTKLLRLSRNFGKENALSAGIAVATGKAVIMLDGDGQHPPERIPDFVKAWKAGAQVVIGIYNGGSHNGWFKDFQSRAFYSLYNRLTDQKLLPGSTDFRLIDRAVQQAFLQLPETDRITRGLIDWLGFRREYISFTAKPRTHGTATYDRRKLLGLASNSLVSLTAKPLYIFGYLGVVITFLSFILGSAVFIEQLILDDPWHWNFTGTAMLGILILFLVGIVLLSQGILSLYVSHIHNQSKQRPLYVIDHEASVGVDEV